MMRKHTIIFLLLGACLALAGCGTMSNGRRWGEDVTLAPGWQQIGDAALAAATSPLVLVPAAAALLLQIGDADTRLSDWGSGHTPVAGSNERAESLSRDLRSASSWAFYLSILATPSGDDPAAWAASKLKGAAVQGSAAFLNHQIVNSLKDAVGRERPDRSNDQSFPSGIASDAAMYASFAARNVRTMTMPDPARTGLCVLMHALPYVVAWERVEAKAHYPSDGLTSIALSYFMSSFFNDSFMGLEGKTRGTPVAGFNGREAFIGYCWRF